MKRDELVAICRNVEFQNWRIRVHGATCLRLRVEFGAFDNHDEANDDLVPQYGRWWYVSPDATESEVVRTIWAAVLMAVEHETREQFKYKGHGIFDPHFDVADLIPKPQPKPAVCEHCDDNSGWVWKYDSNHDGQGGGGYDYFACSRCNRGGHRSREPFSAVGP